MEPINSKYNVLIKTLVIGDSGVGKTTLCNKLVHNIPPDIHYSTIGVDFFIKYYEINNKKYKLQMWDTAGQEKFDAVINSYFRNSKLIILMFDLNSEINSLDKWFNKINKLCPPDVKVIIVGNKCDLERKSNLENLNKYNYLEISIKENKNLNELEKLIKNIIVNIKESDHFQSLKLENFNNKKSKKCC